jgi:hypothetical protein
MKKQIRQNRIAIGKTEDNWLLDFPTFLKSNKECFYKLSTGKRYDLTLVFNKTKLSELGSNYYKLQLPLTPIKNDDGTAFNFIVNWGDSN